jgi:hypothetical protein
VKPNSQLTYSLLGGGPCPAWDIGLYLFIYLFILIKHHQFFVSAPWSHGLRQAASNSYQRVRLRFPPAVLGFLYRDYSYKSVATQIPHDAELAPTPYTNLKFSQLHSTSKAWPWDQDY